MAECYKQVVERAREAYASGRTRSLEFRRHQLMQLRKMYTDNTNTLLKAIVSDLRKPMQEAMSMEVNEVLQDTTYILNRLDKWVKRQAVSSPIPFDKSYIYSEPYGVVLVMGSWNYPLHITMIPFAGALAAGNVVIIKPSEVSPATASVLAKLIPQYLDEECYQVVCGGVSETTLLLQQRFDYIFYTGSTAVGKIIRDAANRFLTPTTLELGGKSPCYIDHTVDMDLAVRRVLWGKLINLGQTCIAPDYVLCSEDVQEQFVKKAKAALHEWYGDDPQKSPDLARIVSEKHVKRLESYLECGTVAVGGRCDRNDLWVEPTLLVDVAKDSAIMQEEIFGPILPFINVKTHAEAIAFINKRSERPLALYVFSREKKVMEAFVQQVSCGGITLNDTIFHFGNKELPFGGVGGSGMGSYHGRYTFDTFTHKKACLSRTYNPIIEKVLRARFPPYTEGKMKVMTSHRDRGEGPGLLYHLALLTTHLLAMALGALLYYHLYMD